MLNETSDSVQDMLQESESTFNGKGQHGCACGGRAVEGCEADALAALCSAVIAPDRAEGERQLASILRRGYDRDMVIDTLIPGAARFFGEAWSNGGHSFAEVTIAVARLQGWLRELDGNGGVRQDPFRMDAPEILLVVPEGSHHTLGAMVVMSRFRRLGTLVRLSLGQDIRTIGRVVRSGHYDMVAVSAAGNEGVDFLAKLTNSIRSGLGPSPLVVLGGEILNQNSDAPALVGADFGTSDPEEALTLCGLMTSADGEAAAHNRASTRRGSPPRVSAGM